MALQDFYSQFSKGFQQPERFVAQLVLPQGLLQTVINPNFWVGLIDDFIPGVGAQIDPTFSASKVSDWLSQGLLCTATRLPDRDFKTYDFTIYGYQESVPTKSVYTDIECSFLMPLVVSDNAVPRFFNYWHGYIQSQINGPTDGMNFTFPGNYYGQMYLSLLDRQNNPTITYFLDRIYPRTLNTSNVTWENGQKFMEQQVTFRYSYYTVMPYSPLPILSITF